MSDIEHDAARSRVTLGVLGPLVAGLDEEEINLGGPRQRAVVAMLVLADGQQVSAARLLDALWEGAPPPSGAAGLQAYVSHLRRALEPGRPARTPSSVIVSRGDGYVVPRDAVDVDAWRFEALVTEADTVSDPGQRLAMLREGLALWRGPALAEYSHLSWAEAATRRLEGLRDVAAEQLLAARLDSGEAALVIPELESLLRQSPLREERWRMLALAQYRSHRQADALATLRSARERLADELGVDPGPALRSLELEILAQSPGLDLPARRREVQREVQREVRRPPASAGPELVDRD